MAGANDTRIVLVNTSATDANNVAIELNGSASSATFLSLAGPSLESTTGETLNGTAIAADGSWPVLTAPALPVVNGHIQVPVPPGSALLVDRQVTTKRTAAAWIAADPGRLETEKESFRSRRRSVVDFDG